MQETILLHACCAPCSTAIMEWLLTHDYKPVVFFYNPNIYPDAEYLLRKNECARFCDTMQVPFYDGDPDHQQWVEAVRGLEDEPERGERCRACFGLRMRVTAKQAQTLGIPRFTTTLAGSRWKRLEQIRAAAFDACAVTPGVEYWDKDWKKGGLQERKAILIKEGNYYKQQWCGCEYSMAHLIKRDDTAGLPAHAIALFDAIAEEEVARHDRIRRGVARMKNPPPAITNLDIATLDAKEPKP